MKEFLRVRCPLRQISFFGCQFSGFRLETVNSFKFAPVFYINFFYVQFLTFVIFIYYYPLTPPIDNMKVLCPVIFW